MPKTILIVEDFEGTRDFIKFVLEDEGYQVIEAGSGSEAIDKFKETQPDLILMDVSLPIMDGLSAARIIRKLEGVTKTPIIAVTGHGESFYEKAMEAGCDQLICKPINFNTLHPILNQYLKGLDTVLNH